MRAARIQNLIPMRVLAEKDIEPARLAGHMRSMLQTPRSAAVELNLNGASNTLNILTGLFDQHGPATA